VRARLSRGWGITGGLEVSGTRSGMGTLECTLLLLLTISNVDIISKLHLLSFTKLWEVSMVRSLAVTWKPSALPEP